VFELNILCYDLYLEGSTDVGDAEEQKKGGLKHGGVDVGCSKSKSTLVLVRKRRKVEAKAKEPARAAGVTDASNKFFDKLAEMCAKPGEDMASHVLREAYARMFKATRGEWWRDVPIPVASGEDDSTSFWLGISKNFLMGGMLMLL
jgi:hypothetical protein